MESRPPAVLYADKNIVDTLWARDSLYLQVATFQIDSTSQSIYDVKPQSNLPFRFGRSAATPNGARSHSYCCWRRPMR